MEKHFLSSFINNFQTRIFSTNLLTSTKLFAFKKNSIEAKYLNFSSQNPFQSQFFSIQYRLNRSFIFNEFYKNEEKENENTF